MCILESGFVLQGSKYQILRMLGKGGFGITYEGMQTGLNRKVAIKEFFMEDFCIRANDDSTVIVTTPKAESIVANYREKFYKEAKTIAHLSHEHIIKVIDVFYENNTAYYVMEHIAGGSLTDYVERYGPVDEEYAWQIIGQIGSALSFVHQHHVLHLDIKPDNIMLRAKADAVLIDFGIAKQYTLEGNQLTTTPTGLTRGYAPLEQYYENGVAVFTPATDVYSLGATMFYLLTGCRPPEAQDVAERGLPPLPENVSQRTQQAIFAAMQPLIKNRLQNVTDFLSWQVVDHLNSNNDMHNMRFVIEQLISQKAYKEAYNRCVDCLNRGEDLEYTKNKIDYLLPIIKKKASRRNSIMYFIAFLILILSLILPIIISLN